MLSIVATNRISAAIKVVSYRTFSTSKVWSYQTGRVCSAPPDLIAFRPTDYGKYYVPSTWENILMSFADSAPVKLMVSYLTMVHEYTGLPWWATIIICTITLRATITAPLFVWQTKKMMKYRMLQPTLQKITEELAKEGDTEAKLKNWDKKTRDMHVFNSFKKHQKRLYSKHKVPGTLRRYLLPWVQLPLWISMSTALRSMTLFLPVLGQLTPLQISIFSSLSTGGVLWFSNLCTPDPYMVLPVLAGLSNLAIIEIHRGDGKTPLIGGSRVLINVLRILSISLIPIGSFMPSGVVLYWVASSSFGLTQALAMQSIKFKTLLRLPIPPNHSKTPYRDILNRFQFGDKTQ